VDQLGKSGGCCKALSNLYSKMNKEGFPLGIQARFVQYSLDSRFITTAKMAQNVERMKSKQKKFNDRTSTARLGLSMPRSWSDTPRSVHGIMIILTAERNLFVAVDQMTNYSSSNDHGISSGPCTRGHYG
jgi:hypothetical protein